MLPYAYSAGLPVDTTTGTTMTMPVNGLVAIPFPLPDEIWIQSIHVRTADTSGTHGMELIVIRDNGFWQGTFQTGNYNASAAATRRVNTSAPIHMPPGTMWLIIRNSGAVSNILGAVAAGTISAALCPTSSLATSLSEGLPEGLTWASQNSIPLVRLQGSLGGLIPGSEL